MESDIDKTRFEGQLVSVEREIDLNPLKLGSYISSSVPADKSSPSQWLSDIIKSYQEDGELVGEERNIAKLFLIACSKDLPRDYRIHAIIISQSSAGKSTLAKTVTEPFSSDVRHYTRFTGAALDRSEETYDGKILFYEQMEGDEPFQIKLLLSEGELSILVVDTDEQGRKKTRNIRVEGMPSFITTTTNPTIDQELQNRSFTISLDESKEQTKRIMEHHAKKYSTIKTTKITRWLNIKRIIEAYTNLRPEKTISSITIPFSELIPKCFPNHLEMRRDFDRILRLASIIATLKSVTYRGYYDSSKVDGVSEKLIIAETEDFDDAIWCMGENLHDALYRLNGKAKDIYNVLQESIIEGAQRKLIEESKPLTAKEISRELGIGQKTAYRYAEYLVDRGLATVEKDGRTNLYQPVEDSTPDIYPVELKNFDMDEWKRNNVSMYKFVSASKKEPKLKDSSPNIHNLSLSKPESYRISDSEVSDTDTNTMNGITQDGVKDALAKLEDHDTTG